MDFWIPVIISTLALIASAWIGVASYKSASESAAQAKRSADLAAKQLELTVEAQKTALQPYVWADLRARDDAAFLMLCIGNSGPTVATDVRVSFEPTLVSITGDKTLEVELFENRCREGLQSIAPGATFMWSLDILHKHFPNNGADPVPNLRVQVTANGPHGPVEPLDYFIGLEDQKHQDARPTGLAIVEKPLKTLAEQAQKFMRTQRGS